VIYWVLKVAVPSFTLSLRLVNLDNSSGGNPRELVAP